MFHVVSSGHVYLCSLWGFLIIEGVGEIKMCVLEVWVGVVVWFLFLVWLLFWVVFGLGLRVFCGWFMGDLTGTY